MAHVLIAEARFYEDLNDMLLDGVRADDWRILIGPDAEAIDEAVRKTPKAAYEGDFGLSIFARLREAIAPG